MTKQEFLDTILVANETSIEVLKALVAQIDEPVAAPKEDVLVITKDTLKNLVADIVSEISNLDTSAIDDYELSLNYNEVVIDSISINEREVQYAVEAALERYIDVIDED